MNPVTSALSSTRMNGIDAAVDAGSLKVPLGWPWGWPEEGLAGGLA